MDFFSFEAALLRLKGALALQADKDVAAVLGMGASAFNQRKRRGSFPEEELRALAQQRPDLGIDVHYVLTGITTEAQARLDAKQGRISRAVDAGMGMEDIRAMERLASSASPERLLSLGAMLSDMRSVEFDAIYTLAETITELRSAAGKKPTP
jgi:collagenase-like PrtC family protease